MEMRLKMKRLAYQAQLGRRLLKPSSVWVVAIVLALALGPWAVALAAGANNVVGTATDISTLLPVVNDTTDNTNATRDVGEVGTCGSYRLPPVNTRSLWYKYTALSSGWLTVDTRNSTYDTVLEVYTPTVASPSAGQLVSVARFVKS